MATLRRVVGSHSYGIRSARSGLVVGSGNHRVSAEWRTLTEEQRGMGLVGDFKRSSKGDFWWRMGFSSVGWRVSGCVGTAVLGIGTLRIRGWLLVFVLMGLL
jgi:hypothetical protein